MFGAPKAVHRIAAGALIAPAILLRPSASTALDSITFITDFAFNGAHAYFFEAVDRGYYRDAGLEVKIVRGQGSNDAIRQVGAGNAMFGLDLYSRFTPPLGHRRNCRCLRNSWKSAGSTSLC
jgi:ABC-type nitrate/sulfonate/bicarbonate transport system substrate-binding protein